MLRDNVEDLEWIYDGVDGSCEHVPNHYIFTCIETVVETPGIRHVSDMAVAVVREHDILIHLMDGYSLTISPDAWDRIQSLPDHDEGARERKHQEDTAWFREMDEELRLKKTKP